MLSADMMTVEAGAVLMLSSPFVLHPLPQFETIYLVLVTIHHSSVRADDHDMPLP